MKEMPEKIYVYIPDDDTVGTASLQKGFPHQFVTEEYARADVFIEKACDWLERNGSYYIGCEQGQPCVTEELIKSLKKYMEGKEI